MHWLEAVANIRKGSTENGGHGVRHEGGLQLIGDLDARETILDSRTWMRNYSV